MYSHCVHCAASLGRNELLEAFPVGRRVAFDGLKGRLWVVCPRCERWNLAPFESRWEAIEQAERAYRDTSVRMATDNIGLARWRDGTQLVRIGRPLRPEFAAWRYGDQFGRRRRRALVLGSVAGAGAVAAATGLVATGIGLAALAPILHTISLAIVTRNQRARMVPLAHPDGKWFVPFGNPRLVPVAAEHEGWGVEIGWQARLETPRIGLLSAGTNGEKGRVTLTGELAQSALTKLLPSVNGMGAPRARVQQAVTLLDDAGGPERFMTWAMEQRRAWGAQQTFGDTGDLGAIPREARLAIEMAVHEERERLALLGELAALERAWRDAEEIAAIADRLLVDPTADAARRSSRSASADGSPDSPPGSPDRRTSR